MSWVFASVKRGEILIVVKPRFINTHIMIIISIKILKK